MGEALAVLRKHFPELATTDLAVTLPCLVRQTTPWGLVDSVLLQRACLGVAVRDDRDGRTVVAGRQMAEVC